jgi:hypothetical protein
MMPEPYASIIHFAQINILVSIVNMLTSAALIYGTLMLRKAIKLNRETSRLLNERASAIEARQRQDREDGPDPKGESAAPQEDAQPEAGPQ